VELMIAFEEEFGIEIRTRTRKITRVRKRSIHESHSKKK
jgi:acyl carrier protein